MYKMLTLALLLMTGTAIAEESPFKRHDIKPIVYTDCQAGHLFVIAASENGVSVMQVFQDAGDMVPKPIECPPKEVEDDE